MTESTILEQAYQTALQLVENQAIEADADLDQLIAQIDSNKSIVAALVTSLVKKIAEPTQDVRLHRVDFVGGYSARSLDTQWVSPFFKRYFPKYANKESSFLTLATRERLRWDLVEGVHLKIRNKQLKSSFLRIFEQLEVEQKNPEAILTQLLARLIQISKANESLFQSAFHQTESVLVLNIRTIVQMLETHFSLKWSSRLPVIAIYSIYELLMARVGRYLDKKLLPLQVHTASDKKGFGDIEIYDANENPFEILEIKHQIPINRFLIFDVLKKVEQTTISRYYILTTYPNEFESREEEQFVSQLILQARKEQNIDMIANGIVTTLKYYLRFLDDYDLFIKTYTKNLITDAHNSTEVKNLHIESWLEILKKYELCE